MHAMTTVAKLSCAIILSLSLGVTAQAGWTKEISAANDYCREINDPSSGTEVVMQAGDYRGACKVKLRLILRLIREPLHSEC
jgi:hypothetical protein